jgi:GH15 family glucan-1,4-alpha-glucosidase
MVKPMADFLAGYIDSFTGLPKPSYDLWEQTFITSTYTTAVTYAALMAASDLAADANDPNNAVKWRSAASDIQSAAHKYLYNNKRQVFYRGIYVSNGQITYDDVVDCSGVFGSYIFGLFAPDSHEIQSSVKTVEQTFGINHGSIGLPRYENDPYRRSSPDIAGNLWYVTSLWLAQYYIDSGNNEKAMVILDWVKNHSMSTSVMGEQINPITNEIISPAPLTWSHAEYLSTLLDLITVKS